MIRKFCPRSLMGQMMLAVAVALLLAQGVGAGLAYRATAERREAALLHSAAFRLLVATRGERSLPPFMRSGHPERGRGFRIERRADSPLLPREKHDEQAERELRRILSDQDLSVGKVVVLRRDVEDDEIASRRIRQQEEVMRRTHSRPRDVLIAAIELPNGSGWMVARVFGPLGEREIVLTLLAQTLLIYVVLVGALASILRRITRPLAALTGRLEQFAETRSPDGQLPPQGPDDVRRLIVAHNAMEARIAALLGEKDVMLGAIGHDLKTPLAALRVRIESVPDDAEREKMAATIEDITRTLDDILSLARVGRPTDPLESTDLAALVASVVEEFEDMGEPVTFEESQRIALPLRATWLRRALRNLIGNALRYGEHATVSLLREHGDAVIRIEDEGPGIPGADLARMMEPFTRGESSRNRTTGGAGLGLAIARAIAEQHGGRLILTNRPEKGLRVDLRLPTKR